VEQVAYRFVPCDDEGRPRENSQYTMSTTQKLAVGGTINHGVLGYSKWEVVELRPESRPLLGASDRLGNDVPLVGTLVSRGIA
jgi:hypothetical protein